MDVATLERRIKFREVRATLNKATRQLGELILYSEKRHERAEILTVFVCEIDYTEKNKLRAATFERYRRIAPEGYSIIIDKLNNAIDLGVRL